MVRTGALRQSVTINQPMQPDLFSAIRLNADEKPGRDKGKAKRVKKIPP